MAGPGKMQMLAPQSGRPHHDASADGTEMDPQNSPAVKSPIGEIPDGGRSKPPTPTQEPEVQTPTQQSEKRKREEQRLRKARHRKLDLNNPPKLFGVYVGPSGWKAYLWVSGVRIPGCKKRGIQIFLGNFKQKDLAMVVRDITTLKLKETCESKAELNFPDNIHYRKFMEKHMTWDLRDFVWTFRHQADKSMKGVTCYLTGINEMVYVTRISQMYKEPVEEKQMYELGTFTSQDEAGRAYDLALLFIHKKCTYWENLRVITNFRPSKYSEHEILEAGTTHGLRQVETLAQSEAETNHDID